MVNKSIYRLGCLDIGSNAIKYKQYRIKRDHENFYEELEAYKRIPIRLGTDAFRKRKIKKKTVHKLVEELETLLLQLNLKNVNLIGGYATSAMRTASNGKEICHHIKQNLDIDLTILSGEDEARLLSHLTEKYPQNGTHLFVDVGGGSTEIYYENGESKQIQSFNLGAVRVYLEEENLSDWKDLEDYLSKLKDTPVKKIIGVGGNIRSIISIINKNQNLSISIGQLEACMNELVKFGKKEKMKMYSLSRDRADIIESATKIFIRIMSLFPNSTLQSASWSICDALVKDFINKNHAGLSSEFNKTSSLFKT
jgi:exopolyphosphatase/guanosine-5'-triphosphate,3'-diphosphate pyrophosphatase|tara:strand:+ start:589 stop:1518 length:930 start_codon:yes stop_codon:yes gene_type:complete